MSCQVLRGDTLEVCALARSHEHCKLRNEERTPVTWLAIASGKTRFIGTNLQTIDQLGASKKGSVT